MTILFMFPSVLKDLKIHFNQVAPTKGTFSADSNVEGDRSLLFMFSSVLTVLKIHFSQVAPTKSPFPTDSKNRI